MARPAGGLAPTGAILPEADYQGLIRLTRDLIRTPSLPGQERRVAEVDHFEIDGGHGIAGNQEVLGAPIAVHQGDAGSARGPAEIRQGVASWRDLSP